jgi:hypothetical protein
VRPGVSDAWLTFSMEHEGYTQFFDLDVKRLVTIGIGELVDPLSNLDSSYLSRFVDLAGNPVTPAEVIAAWQIVKSDKTLNPLGGGLQYSKLTTVRMTKGAIMDLTLHKLAAFEGVLRTHFPNWDTAPAHAQLAMLSHAWAFGPNFPTSWPHLTQAFNLQAYNVCADQCVPSAAEMAAQNVSFHDRIAQEQVHFRAAAVLLTVAGADLNDLSIPS